MCLQIQRQFRAWASRCCAVRNVAATWPSPDEFIPTAGMVALVSSIRAKRQQRLVRAAIAQLRSYTAAHVERRRQLHIRRCVQPSTAVSANTGGRRGGGREGGREGSLFLLPYCIVLPHAAVSLSAGGGLRGRFGRYMHQHLGGGPFDGSQIFAASGRLVMLDRWAAWRRCAVVWVALLRYSFGPRHIQYERDDQRR